MIRSACKLLPVLTALTLSTQLADATDLPPYPLTIQEAISRGVQANVNTLTAGTRVTEAQGVRERRLSAYLPHLRIETPVAYQTRNLKAQGINFASVPDVVGPFASYDFRIYAEQTVFDLQSYHSIKASELEHRARQDDYEDVRSRVILQVAVNYINAAYAAAKVATAESRVRTAAALEELARDQRQAGVADGLDILRAQVQLANDRQVLLVAKNFSQQTLLTLARSIGIDLATPLQLVDKLVFRQLDAPPIEQAVKSALECRPDYRSLLSQRESFATQLKASSSRYLPKVTLSANYGVSGTKLAEVEPSGMIQANLVLTLFDLDRKGERTELESRLKRIEQQLADQRSSVEQEIREALLNLQSAAEQVIVSGSGQELAERELEFASDRFKNGVANNIEVVTAQDALARARDNQLNALAQHVEAKISLARALGDMENNYRLFLGSR